MNLTKFLPTLDDWYPNYPRHTVRCSLVQLPTTKEYRVCVWGADDTGMERDFESYDEAKEEYDLLPNPITKDYLRIRDFIPA